MIKRKIVGYYKDSTATSSSENQPRAPKKKQYVSILTNKPVVNA
jgi:hypothetical protein